ncbi:MAG TPA: M48 family metalloprotease [Candidatus Colwellbacteria bacterium]|jgi:heat shock protein HtpX|nr:M48 family metalloprotease [Candidatus Colwellbacteria bacterium]
MARNIYAEKEANVKRTWMLFTVFVAVVIGLGWGFGYFYDNPAILLGAIVFSVFMSATSFLFSDNIALSLAGAKPVARRDNPELHRLVENLAIAAGAAQPAIYIVDDPSPNAFATGRSPERSAIAVTTGLLQKLDRQELEGVLGHELSHIENRDTLVATTAAVLVGFVAILADIFMRMPQRGRDDNDRELRGVLYLVGLVFAMLAPVAVNLIQLAISRKREFLADASSALLTRYPEGLASALQKISEDQTPLRSAASATAHLWIANPLKSKEIVSHLFSTHPPIGERIERLREMSL